MKNIQFYKYQAAGNDFLFIDENDAKKFHKDKIFEKFCQSICHRQFGIGADGLIYLETANKLPTMRYFNSDGTYAAMCGNGMRAFRQYLYDFHQFIEPTLVIQTANKKTFVELLHSEQIAVTLDTIPEIIPIQTMGYKAFYTYTMTDHVVLEVEEIPEDFMAIGRSIENDSQFKKGTNVNFVKRLSETKLEVVTWERGAGATLACGTGVCAAALVMKSTHYSNNEIFDIQTKGGHLKVIVDETIKLIGDAQFIAQGKYAMG